MENIHDMVVHAGSVDIGAACEQSGRIAHEERMPSTGDRMYGFAQEIRDGKLLLNLGCTVISDDNGILVMEGTKGTKVFKVVVQVTEVGSLKQDETSYRWTKHYYADEAAELTAMAKLAKREFTAWKDKVVREVIDSLDRVHPDHSGLDLPFWTWWENGTSVDDAAALVISAYDWQDRA